MKRLIIISLFSVLMLTFIIIGGYSFQTSKEEAHTPLISNSTTYSIPSEIGVFERSEFALDYLNIPDDDKHKRSLNTYYKNRAFYGAPPSIPHEVEDDRNMGDKSCLKCHENGGFVKKYKAYTPVTPHPQFVNCRQCHVPQNTNSVFVATNWKNVSVPELNNAALEGSPPVIPHQLQLRENCLACHAGPAAPVEIKVSHPDRINCRQCHVPGNMGITVSDEFIRLNYETNE